jgi:hypothetical protein
MTNPLSKFSRSTTIGLSAVAMTISALPATAHDRHGHNPTPVVHYAANDASFRAAHPIRVFIKLSDENRENWGRKGHGHGKYSGFSTPPRMLHKIDHYLPGYVRLVQSPAEADLVMKVRRTDYSLNFRIIDVDQKDKKYKNSRKYSRGRCGLHHRAFYTKVKEKGEAYASYNVKAVLKGIDRDRDHFTLRSAENFTYGKDLRATTNCGMRPTNVMPSSGVAELFAKSNKGYRHHVAREIRREASTDLSRQLAHRIRSQSNHFYVNLAMELNERHNRQHERYGYNGSYRQYPHSQYPIG